MDAMNAHVGPGRQTLGPPQPVSPYWRLLIRFWWVGILVVLIVVAILGGSTTSPAGVSTSNRAATNAPVATQVAPVGVSTASIATPSAQQKGAWYLYQETHEGNYCQCNK